MHFENFEFYSSRGTNHDHRRRRFVWEHHPCIWRTEAHLKTQQVVTQALSAPSVRRRPFLEDSVQQVCRWGLPSVWYLFTSRSTPSKKLKASFQETLPLLLTTDEAFIKVQLWMKQADMWSTDRDTKLQICWGGLFVLPLILESNGIPRCLVATSTNSFSRPFTLYR